MVWTAWPGVNARSRLGDDVTIDGKRFGIMTWEADNHGVQWRYVALPLAERAERQQGPTGQRLRPVAQPVLPQCREPRLA